MFYRAPVEDLSSTEDQTFERFLNFLNMERVPVEVWQQVLLNVMEANDWPIFATSCTPYTFLYFMEQQTSLKERQKPYLDYLEQRRRLRLVCRAWNGFALFTSHHWLRLEERSPMYKLDSTTTTRAKRGVGPIERLSMTINSKELVIPILSWVSHILKRPAHQSPLRAYKLQLRNAPVKGYNPFDDLLVGSTTTQGTECTGTNTTLHSLSITTSRSLGISISFSQISRTFTGLRSLFLSNVKATPQQTLRLAHLEVLHVYYPDQGPETLQASMEKWDTPALRHVCLEYCATPLTEMVDRFLGRYAHQIESLVLEGITNTNMRLTDLPSGFWAQFTALRLLGVGHLTLVRNEWSGWSIAPPSTHPCQYLVCRLYLTSEHSVELMVGDIRSRWTWHDGVRLVTGTGHRYYVVKNIQDDPSIENMERTTSGVLPEL
jgi:hypothetical protein